MQSAIILEVVERSREHGYEHEGFGAEACPRPAHDGDVPLCLREVEYNVLLEM